MKKTFTASYIAKVGIFSALAFILYVLNFPLPLFPSFLEIHLSDFPALISGFALGPLGGALTVLVKILIKLPFTSTMGVGECSDLINGLAFVLPASIIYKKNKSKKSAVIGITAGAVCSVVTSIFANWLIIIPFYLKVMKWDLAMIVSVCSKVIPFITEGNFYPCYLFLSVLPFNTLRCLVVSLLTVLVYKRISVLLKRF